MTEDSPKIKKYIGTAQIADGGLVFHLFEIYGNGRRGTTLSNSPKGVKRIKEALKDIEGGRTVSDCGEED